MTVRSPCSQAVDGYLQATPPAPSVPWRQASYAVVGLKATGPEPRRDEIITIACVPVERGRAIMGMVSQVDLEGARASQLQEALDSILEALTGRVLVAHAASVQVGLLSAALRRAGVRLRGPTLDTAVLAMRVPRRAAAEADLLPAPVDTSPGLSRAVRGMGLPVHRPHHASGDALTTAQLFMALATHLDRADPQSVGSLARLSGFRAEEKPSRRPGRFEPLARQRASTNGNSPKARDQAVAALNESFA